MSRIDAATVAWMDKELGDHLNPQGWKEKEKGKRCVLLKKEGLEPPYYKVQGPMNGVTVDKLIDIVHTRSLDFQKNLNSNFLSGHIIEKVGPDALGGAAAEGVYYYQQSKLPVVDNRDFVTFTIMKPYENPARPGKKCCAFFSRSVNHPKAPELPKGFKRANLECCCAFLEEVDGGVMYTYTQQVDIHFPKAMKKPVQTQTKEHLMKFFGLLHDLALSQ
eukprot:TRINITY_DN54615_c0_g2_i1.p2 TRINITY_DN54615_c0_g2~~TRINITY_DN54615_c0_g2_i1.p2  ORF type:complete len:219 (+),score=50.61 TRINITY_DN54615_c0_g2_i1:57-713(+)